ncbi:DedA family protein [Nonomuraea sp. NPDC049141]|uniref:DedA family protein n=1 Tax=Nonomuraea sp. NPDC049141 TaxID=3155500 RepID=UPI00341113CA
MGLLDVLACTTLGSLIGTLALYWIGALLGRERVLAIAAKLPLVKVSDIEKTEAWFLRHGRKTVFFGRMIPLFRSLISIPVGVERMPLPTFTLLTMVGSLIWNTVFVLAGYFLGENWSLVETYVGLGTNVVVAMVVAAVLVSSGTAGRAAQKPPSGSPLRACGAGRGLELAALADHAVRFADLVGWGRRATFTTSYTTRCSDCADMEHHPPLVSQLPRVW